MHIEGKASCYVANLNTLHRYRSHTWMNQRAMADGFEESSLCTLEFVSGCLETSTLKAGWRILLLLRVPFNGCFKRIQENEDVADE